MPTLSSCTHSHNVPYIPLRPTLLTVTNVLNSSCLAEPERTREMIAHVPAIDLVPRNEIPMREEEVDRFRELPEFLDKFFKFFCLLSLPSRLQLLGKNFPQNTPHVMMVLVFMIMLYFLLWLLGTMLQHRIEWLRKMLFWIMLVTGSVSSVLVLTIINLVIALLALLFWAGIFAVIAYYNSPELYQLFVSPVSDIINRLIESYRGHVARLPV